MSSEIAALLAEHEWTWRVFQGRILMVCQCGDELIPWTSSGVAGPAEHRAHLATVLAKIPARAWDEGFTRGFYDSLAGGVRDASESAAVNPYGP